MNLDFENLKSYTTEELEDAQKLLSQELRRRNQEKQEMETLERLAAKYGLRVTKESMKF